ncbi:unnamed protein product [Cochlearia groenlandica]
MDGGSLDKLESRKVGEGNMESPTFSLGLTQEMKKKSFFRLCYVRKNKRTKFPSSSYDDFVMEPTGKSKHDIVTTMFQPPPSDMVVQIRNHMVEPSYFPEYNEHTLFEVHFKELLDPTKLTYTEVMDTLVEYLHQNVVQQSSTNHPPKYDFLDFTFLNDISLLHELIEPAKRRKKLPVKTQLVDYLHAHNKLDDNIQLTRNHVVGTSHKYASEVFKAIA